MSQLILRDYQVRAENGAFDEWESGKCSTLCVIPTGGGKTVLFASIIRRMGGKAMVVAHRKELLQQARDKIFKTTGLESEIEMADQWANADMFRSMPVVVASIQTLQNRMERWNPMDFKILIIDEAHHAISPSYRRLIEYFRRRNPNIKIFGCTATPDRCDEEALGQVFESVCFDYEILDAINEGWLVNVNQQLVNIEGLDFSAVRTTAGDLNGADLARLMEEEQTLQGMVGASVEIIGERKAIVFTSSVKHAKMTSDILNRHRNGMSDWVCGETREDLRKGILRNFAAGKLQVVCNCGVLTEGFDDPGVEVIIMGRPTKSRALYSQMVGRSTRPIPGIVDGLSTPDERKAAIASSPKKDCLVVDFVGNSGKHKLMTSADVLSGNVSDEAIEIAVKKIKESGKAVCMSLALDEAQAEIVKRKEEARIQEEARRSKLIAKVQFKAQFINPFDVLSIAPQQARGWDYGKALTEGRKKVLVDNGLNPADYTYPQAVQLVAEICERGKKGLCSYKQALKLKESGHSPNVSVKEAEAKLGAAGMLSAKQNGALARCGYNASERSWSDNKTLLGWLHTNNWPHRKWRPYPGKQSEAA